MVHVMVDLTSPENADSARKTELEESEFIETFSVPLKNFMEQLKNLEREGYAIDARIATIAEGIQVAQTWKL